MTLSQQDRDHIDFGFFVILVEMDRMQRQLRKLIVQEREQTMGLEQIEAAVSNMEQNVATRSDVEGSASSLLDQLSQLIRDNANDPAALQALADRISSADASESSSNAKLAAAVAANTPGAPTGGGEPTP